MKINFDITGQPEEPTIILATREGTKIGQIPAREISGADYLNEAAVFQFKVYKEESGVRCHLWDDLTNFKLVWVKEWDMWFQMVLDVEESTETVKTCECTKLGEAELSQIMLYTIEINTENDILRDDYTIPTVFWNPDHPEASLLHRMMEKCPHYSVAHVDNTLRNIQRTFTFDDISIYDAFQEVAEEIGCLFVFDSDSDSDGNISRTISVYDLESNCNECGYRGEFTETCPECGSTDINEGYGEDTTIFVTADELSDDILYTTNTDAVKNCFKLEAGDDLMTATVRNCNPNGSDYIYYFSDESKAEMPSNLVSRIESYDELYDYYQNDYVVGSIPSSVIRNYNDLITKYQEYNSDLETIPTTIVGYPELMDAYYNTIDFKIYLQSGLMPTVSMQNTTAEREAAKLTASAFGSDGVAVSKLTKSTSAETASNAVVNMAKCIVDLRYQVKNITDDGRNIPNIEITYKKDDPDEVDYATWTGALSITNYSDDDDFAETSVFSVKVTSDYETYLRQCIEKSLNNDNTEDMSITGLFELDYDDFVEELKKYCLDSLNMFYNSCESCLDILIEQGAADKETWGTVTSGSDPYTNIYVPYSDKLNAITDEIIVREGEIAVISSTYDADGDIVTKGLQTYIEEAQSAIHSALDFEAYLGETLWLQFCAYRREDKYTNSNYISDGLNNAELFSLAREFLDVASQELYKSAELQHSIESDLNNLLMLDKFKPLLDCFEVGNWLRLRIDDNIYKLRLIGYELEWDNLEAITLEFSDVMKIKTGVSDLQAILEQATKMATSYDAVQHQASQGADANTIVAGWTLDGLDVTNTRIIQAAEGQDQSWDQHGMLFRKYNDATDQYDDEQMKIINSTIAITSDNWDSVRTAIGRFYYTDPKTGNLTEAYGINAEVLIGQLILGENIGLYNTGGTLTFDDTGLTITNGDYTFAVTLNGDNLVEIYNNKLTANNDLFYVTNKGNLYITGAFTASNGTNSITIDPNNSSSIITITNEKTFANVLSTDSEGNLIISGTITATSGKIGNWYINSDSISSVEGSGYNTSGNMYIGSSGISIGNNTFYVSSSGSLYANNATITGTITAGAGSQIGGWYVTNGKICAGVGNDGKLPDGSSAPSGYTVGVAVMQIPGGTNGSATNVFAAGSGTHSNYSDGCEFRVTKAGALYSTDINVYHSYKLLMNDASITIIQALGDYPAGSSINDFIIGLGTNGLEFYQMSGSPAYACFNIGVQIFSTEGIDSYGNILVRNTSTGYSIMLRSTSENNVGLYANQSTWFFRYNLEENACYVGVSGGYMHMRGVYNHTTSSSANMHIDNSDSTYQVLRYSSSSERYKNVQREITESEVEALFNIPVYLYTYKDGYLPNSDERYGKTIPGFIAEKWDELEPIAVDHEDGLAEVWNDHIVVPLMFEMIKSNHSNINIVEDRLDFLQLEVDQLKEENESLKQELSALTS